MMKEKFKRLLENGDFDEAKKLAERMTESEVIEISINVLKAYRKILVYSINQLQIGNTDEYF